MTRFRFPAAAAVLRKRVSFGHHLFVSVFLARQVEQYNTDSPVLRPTLMPSHGASHTAHSLLGSAVCCL
jgi:hypothetical protein